MTTDTVDRADEAEVEAMTATTEEAVIEAVTDVATEVETEDDKRDNNGDAWCDNWVGDNNKLYRTNNLTSRGACGVNTDVFVTREEF